MSRLRVGVIGTGRKKARPDAMGYAMAYEHADAYQALSEQCELVACADIVKENAEAFALANGIPTDGVFTDYKKMLQEAQLDVVSICTWPHLHESMVLACALAGVRAVHCEKPMADTWGGALRMVQECMRRNVQLTFNHQRRFGAPFRKAYDLLKSGAIGQLQRVEFSSPNLYDYGTHHIDLCSLFTGEQPARWVIGQIDYSHESRVFGAHVENHAIGTWLYPDGVRALIATGDNRDLIGAAFRLIGSEGVIEVGVFRGPLLRIRRGNNDWEIVDTNNESEHGPGFIRRAIADVIDALLTGRESELSGRRALNATEIIFALYESSRRRGRVELPLTISDNPLASMVESGELHPQPQA